MRREASWDERIRARGREACWVEDPSALLRLRLRSGELEPRRVEVAAHAGCALSRAALGWGPPLPPPRSLRAVRSWLRGFERFGLEVQLQVACAAARSELLEAPYRPHPCQLRLVEELTCWSECPCLDHQRGVEAALGPALATLPAGGPLRWAALRLDRRSEEARPFGALCRTIDAGGSRPRLALLREEVATRLQAWGRAGWT